MRQKYPREVAGFSRSLWKSLAVKSIRMGWPEGFRRAMEMLRSTVNWRDVLLAQVFEDIWPSSDQLPEVLEEVRALDLEALCRRDTHHGARRLSRRYAELAPVIEARIFREQGMAKRIGAEARARGMPWLGRRALSEFAIWLEADPPAGGKRSLDSHTWEGMPPAMADMHTPEGRRHKTLITILCGHPDGHIWLMDEVADVGWDWVRRGVHADEPLEGEIRQGGLFEEGR